MDGLVMTSRWFVCCRRLSKQREREPLRQILIVGSPQVARRSVSTRDTGRVRSGHRHLASPGQVCIHVCVYTCIHVSKHARTGNDSTNRNGSRYSSAYDDYYKTTVRWPYFLGQTHWNNT